MPPKGGPGGDEGGRGEGGGSKGKGGGLPPKSALRLCLLRPACRATAAALLLGMARARPRVRLLHFCCSLDSRSEKGNEGKGLSGGPPPQPRRRTGTRSVGDGPRSTPGAALPAAGCRSAGLFRRVSLGSAVSLATRHASPGAVRVRVSESVWTSSLAGAPGARPSSSCALLRWVLHSSTIEHCALTFEGFVCASAHRGDY